VTASPPRGITPPASIAPMMDRTDRHFRYLMRCVSRHVLLYTEMVHALAIVRGDRARFLAHSDEEHPVALQLGGDDPASLAEAARIGEDHGFAEINLNVGCPSEAVQRGRFGACLMAEPGQVARLVEAMRSAVSVPVTVKHRIGIDDRDRFEDLLEFVRVVSGVGCDRFTVHARKAWLSGLSPHQNRTVPPLRHEDVYALKRELPDVPIEINGGVQSLAEVRAHLDRVDAVMIGRAAYDTPYSWVELDREVFGDDRDPPSRAAILERYRAYAAEQETDGVPARTLISAVIGLYAGLRGARAWRRRVHDDLLAGRRVADLLGSPA